MLRHMIATPRHDQDGDFAHQGAPSRRLGLREAGLGSSAVRRKTVLGQRLLDAVVEDVDLANPARFLAVGDLAAELARKALTLLDLLDSAHLPLAVLGP